MGIESEQPVECTDITPVETAPVAERTSGRWTIEHGTGMPNARTFHITYSNNLPPVLHTTINLNSESKHITFNEISNVSVRENEPDRRPSGDYEGEEITFDAKVSGQPVKVRWNTRGQNGEVSFL